MIRPFLPQTLRRILCLAVLLLPTLLLGQDDGSRPIVIQVTDFATGKRVANTMVFVGDGLLMGKRTDRNGLIRMSVIPSIPGEIMIASSDWYLQGRAYLPGARASLPGDPVFEIRLMPGATVSGTIRDLAGKPIANAHVHPLRLSYNVYGRWAPPQWDTSETGVVSNREGEFRIRNLPSGDYVLGLDPPNPVEEPSLGNGMKFYPQFFPGAASWENAKVLRLESGGQLNLGVTSIDTRFGAPIHVRMPDTTPPDGSPIRYRMQATSVSQFALPFFSRMGRISAQGPFDLQLPYGEYLIEEMSEHPRVNGIVVSDATEKTVTLASQYGQLRLNAEMITGEKPPSTTRPFFNLLSGSGYSYELPGNVSIGLSGGRISMDPTKPFPFVAGTIRVLPRVGGAGFRVSGVRINDRELQGDRFEITPGSDTLLTVMLSKDMTSLTGAITDDSGKAVSYAAVALLPDDRSQVLLKRSTLSDSSGKFLIEAPVGDYHVFAWYRLDGSAHLNAEFMKKYDAKGIPVRIGSAPPMPLTLHPLDLRDRLR